MSLTSQHNKSLFDPGPFDLLSSTMHGHGGNPNLLAGSGFGGAVPSPGPTSPVESFLGGPDSRLKTADSAMPNMKRRQNNQQPKSFMQDASDTRGTSIDQPRAQQSFGPS